MTKSILREGRRSIPQPIADKILRHDLPKGPNPFLTSILDIVVAGFQFSPALPFGIFRDSFRGRLGRFADKLPREVKLVPPHIASLERRHTTTPVSREGARHCGREWRLQQEVISVKFRKRAPTAEG